MSFYENIRKVCARHDTTVSAVLEKVGRSTALTGKWKKGATPNAAIVADIANLLEISMDEVYYGVPYDPPVVSREQEEWLRIISKIPKEKHAMLKDFLKTHMVDEPAKYADSGNA